MQRDELWWPHRDELAEHALGDGLWDAYCATHVRIRLPHGAVVVRPCEGPGQCDPPAGPLHVVTACDPGSAGRREDDDLRMQLLAAELCGLSVYPAVGADAAREHAEASLAVVGLSDEVACSLGARYGQVAVFAWRGACWSVLACVGERRHDLGWELNPDRNPRISDS